ncbi:MAG: 2'-5' RNA ligase [Candidatus Reconcilbacillus cellulovorans]|uniref:RNA 2',3'-cyclic phosphodiesterase n=1 Tax=Candidatus Reconcilbacillus cellulovorans TaxID=1906605 RepID=A0A2A6DZC1_9BACL|nr:MAG: 2'-5' RNA ligase [Candidatus Reconcilbacillus cellulovorans]
MDETSRLFVALPIPRDVQTALEEWTLPWRVEFPQARWVHRDDYHVTLKFLGDTPAERLPAIAKELAEIAAATSPFCLELDKPGTFGAAGSPRVLWLGVRPCDPASAGVPVRLAAAVDAGMASLGFPEETRPFRPHVTLARNRDPSIGPAVRRPAINRGWGASFLRATPPDLSWIVDRLTLYRSRLGSRPMYEPLEQFRFGDIS